MTLCNTVHACILYIIDTCIIFASLGSAELATESLRDRHADPKAVFLCFDVASHDALCMHCIDNMYTGVHMLMRNEHIRLQFINASSGSCVV